MTQNNKELLLKDLCARLPYNVVVRCTDSDTDYNCFLTTDILNEIQNGYEYYDYKPYLRPMASMTEKEENELVKAAVIGGYNNSVFNSFIVVDWLNAHHFDYRGLIPMGLALEAQEGMYEKL